MSARARITSVRVAANRGVFMISVAAELAEMHPQTLRTYEARGLVTPQRSPKGTRLYSQEDVEKLKRIQAMTAELGLNLAGVERVLELEGELRAMRARLAELEAGEREAQERLAREIERVRASFRAELVPYNSGKGTAVVRALDVRSPFARRPRRSEDAA
ncbi:MAG: helix-turn-helix transcriptional regulator [Acidobacteriota bacterium]|nr:helix-turn-helix transcriptional regulator [Acidobacteriota bacterium]